MKPAGIPKEKTGGNAGPRFSVIPSVEWSLNLAHPRRAGWQRVGRVPYATLDPGAKTPDRAVRRRAEL